MRWMRIGTGILLVVGLVALIAWRYGPINLSEKSAPQERAAENSAEHPEHDHGTQAVELVVDEQARANLGLKTGAVELTDYWRTLVVPGMVVEQPGKSELRVTTTVNGIVLRVHAFPGQAVRPGDPLVDVRLTGEALATAQANLLRTLKELDLNDAELKRITPLTESGTVSGKVKIDLEYEKRRLEGNRDVQMQELLVRGLAPSQIDEIVARKNLLREFTVTVPKSPGAGAQEGTGGEATVPEPVYAIERISVYPGKLVAPGEELCDIANHTSLMIEGQAFEKEADAIGTAVREGWPVTARFEVGEAEPMVRAGLHILYVDNSVQANSRTFRFYLPIANEVVRENHGADGALYRTWRFKPGQKVSLRVPVEHWRERIVVPTQAVVKEGLASYVFRVNGRMLERVPVTIQYQDSDSAVLANDGSLFPGDEIALNSAYQLNLALKKNLGADPHAGHDHSH